MSHDASHLGFFVSVEDEAGVDVEEAAGQCHGVDLVRIDDLDGERDLAVGVLDDVLADAVDVLFNDGIGDEVGAFLDLIGVGLAHLDFRVGGVPVAHTPAADVPVPYCADVLNAAGLDLDGLAADFDHLGWIDGDVAFDGLGSGVLVLIFLVVLGVGLGIGGRLSILLVGGCLSIASDRRGAGGGLRGRRGRRVRWRRGLRRGLRSGRSGSVRWRGGLGCGLCAERDRQGEHGQDCCLRSERNCHHFEPPAPRRERPAECSASLYRFRR